MNKGNTLYAHGEENWCDFGQIPLTLYLSFLNNKMRGLDLTIFKIPSIQKFCDLLF